MKQNRWKSPVLWTSMFSLIALILTEAGVLHIHDAEVKEIIQAVLVLMTALGVVNSPDNKGEL